MDKIDLIKSLLSLPWYNLILISLFIIPIFLSAWTTVFTTFLPNLTDKQKGIFTIVFVVIYCFGLTIGKAGVDKEREQFYAKYGVAIERKINNDFKLYHIITFNQIRVAYPKVSISDIETIAELYPDKFEIVGIADKDDPRGLKLLSN